MKANLLVLSHAYFLFGTTVYVGTLWALRFFFYQSWTALNVGNVHAHFVSPTKRATRFFTVVVPLMFIASVVMVVTEWGKAQLWQSLAGLAAITLSTVVGQGLIIPVNKRITAGVADDATLVSLLKKWMRYNDIRFVAMTLGWIATVWYFAARGGLVWKL